MKGKVRSFQNLPIYTLEQQNLDANLTLFKEISKKLQQASQLLPYCEFNELFKQIIIKCIRKAQVDIAFGDAIANIRRWMDLYSYDLEILARALMLEAFVMIKEDSGEALEKLTKVKHLVVDTDCEYLLSKVFIMESRAYDAMEEKQMKFKVLKKCIQFGENYTVQYLKMSNEIRVQVADNMIIAYFQMYKILAREDQEKEANDFLSKAYQAALKNYGRQHFSVVTLSEILTQQRNIWENYETKKRKPVTEIQNVVLKKNLYLKICYSWEEEVLIVQSLKVKGQNTRILNQVQTQIQLDRNKINILKKRDYRQWVEASKEEVKVFEEDLRKILEGENYTLPNPKLTKIEKADLFTRTAQSPPSSSSDSDDIPNIESREPILRFLSRDKIQNISRTKSSREKSKENYTSRQ